MKADCEADEGREVLWGGIDVVDDFKRFRDTLRMDDTKGFRSSEEAPR